MNNLMKKFASFFLLCRETLSDDFLVFKQSIQAI